MTDATDFAWAKHRLDEDGFVVIEDALDKDLLNSLRERVIEQAAGERAAAVAHLEWNGANQRLWQLTAKGTVFRELLLHPLLDEMIGHLLGRTFLLSSLTANIAGRGGDEMPLHSDQGYVPFPTPLPVTANVAWMVTDFTEMNGATRVVPGSHRRTELIAKAGPPDGTRTIAATGRAGSALVFDGRLWHGTGRNVTDAPRIGVLSYHCRPWIRQQENHFLALHSDVVRGCDSRLRSRLGWRTWAGLGNTGQGKQGRDDFVDRVEYPVGELDAAGLPVEERSE